MAEKKDIFIFLITLVIGIFTIIFQIFPPRTQADQVKSVLYFLAILGYIGIFSFIIWVMDRIKSYLNQINKNTEQIEKIKEKMDTEKRFNDIDKRISILEALKRNKKGRGFPIDPKVIFLIILLILFYLYLKSLGII